MSMSTPASNAGERELHVVRFSRLNRLLHAIMIVSFMILATTGMTLKFSYTPWASVLARFLGGYEGAGVLHRIAAVFMFSIFTVHIVDLLRRRKRDFGSLRGLIFGPNTMLPTKTDAKDFMASMRWFLNRGPRPGYGRWTYWEKFDYLAVFWGVFVIGSTGLMLWFPEFFTQWIPGWVLNVATIIHSDEALLATGFIFTVHFFNTHLRPEKFPMDLVIFTGRVPLDEFKEERPREYEEMVAAGTFDEMLVEPYPAIVVRAIRFFAWTALSIGFSLVVMIIYAMIFAYR